MEKSDFVEMARYVNSCNITERHIFQLYYRQYGFICWNRYERTYEELRTLLPEAYPDTFQVVTDTIVRPKEWYLGQKIDSTSSKRRRSLKDESIPFYEVIFCYGSGLRLNLVRELSLLEIAKCLKANVFDIYVENAIKCEESEGSVFRQNVKILEYYSLLGISESNKISLLTQFINTIGERQRRAKRKKRQT